MSKWFRWYRGTSENPKFRLAARNGRVTLVTVMAVWQVVLEDAANENHRGVCSKMEDFIAAALDIDDDGTVESALRGLEHVGLISIGIGAITVVDWAKWQYEHDVADPTNATRQKRLRERKRESNGAVTASNAPEADTDTDTDTEKKENKTRDERAPAAPAVLKPPSAVQLLIDDGCNQAAIADWMKVRAAKKAGPITETVVKGLRREATLANVSVSDAVRIATERGWQGFKADWLSSHVKPPDKSPFLAAIDRIAISQGLFDEPSRRTDTSRMPADDPHPDRLLSPGRLLGP